MKRIESRSYTFRRIALLGVSFVALCLDSGCTAQESVEQTSPDAGTGQVESGGPKRKYTNALIGSTSPYLLQHAHNPVNWMPWGPEAFKKAKEENKPVFVSIGYSTCYWCQMMERESFENEQVAKVLNESFVCIKVGREERPDIDEQLMLATQLMTGRGGWPNSVWLRSSRIVRRAVSSLQARCTKA